MPDVSKPAITGNDTNTRITTVTSLSHDGRGVGRVDDKVVFIEGSLPGEQVMFRYLKRRRQYDTGKLLEIVSPSRHRVVPPCEYFGVCGGCALQHLHHDAQIHVKEQILRDHFAKFGRLVPETWRPPLTGVSFHYRRKARLGVRHVAKKGGVLVGFREKASRYIADMSSCLTLDRRFSDLLPALRELVMALSCPDRVPQIEVAAGDDEIALVLRHLVPLTDDDEQTLITFGRQAGAQIYLQPKGPDSIRCLWPENDAGLSYRLPEFNVELFFRPVDFIQVNAGMNRRMVSLALDLLDVQQDDAVLDLFCGLGNFTLPLARRAGRVTAIEASHDLLDRARDNARYNGIDNVEFKRADLYQPLPELPQQGFNKMLIDPPRDGAMEVVKHLTATGPEVILYVSCNPVTLARDSEVLVNVKGYRLMTAGVMDMFPHTCHVESIALFRKP